jgi:hypothetical protein
MSKRFWIRLVGVLALFAWGITAILLWSSMVAPDVTTKANVNVLLFVSLAWTVLVTLLWTVLSLVDGLDHSAQAKTAAAQLTQELRRTMQAPAVHHLSIRRF